MHEQWLFLNFEADEAPQTEHIEWFLDKDTEWWTRYVCSGEWIPRAILSHISESSRPNNTAELANFYSGLATSWELWILNERVAK